MAVEKIGFIGNGNMGGAILMGIIANKAISAKNVFAYDIFEANLERAKKAGATALKSDVEVVQKADIIVLAIKPKDSLEVLKNIKLAIKGKALLSIVAGLDYKTINQTLENTRVLVTLPNTPIQVGEGATGFTNETTFTDEEKKFAQNLFEAVGIVEWVPEKLLFAVSALSGSGPAYAAMFVEALADGGVLEGLPRTTATRLAAQTIKGTGKLILETNLLPSTVKDAVCSPGGTTIEAVKALEKGNFRHSIINAVTKSAQKFSKLINPK